MTDKLQTLKGILQTSRNGANSFTRHALNRKLRYSDGVQEIADEIGAYWLLDIIATECAAPFLTAYEAGLVGVAMIHVKAKDSAAELSMSFKDDGPAAWTRDLAYADLPDHDWLLVLGAAAERDGSTACNLILMSEY